MSLETRLSPRALKCGLIFMATLLLGVPVVCHAFTLDIASHEIGEFGQGPRAIFVPGYGEVIFESGLDGILVVDSAYASTQGFEIPPPAPRELGAHPTTVGAEAEADPGFVKITSRTPNNPASLAATPHPAGDSLENPPGGWNAVPEAASATLGLIGTLLLFLRRREKSVTRADMPLGKA